MRVFEDRVIEAFRQAGFTAGGLELWLHKGNERYLAQCKRWTNKKVGVAIAREMYGIMFTENADRNFMNTNCSSCGSSLVNSL